MPFRLIIFDLLYTLIVPRHPIHVQYSEVFQPYLGKLDPDVIKASFKTALKQVQAERPAYIQGRQSWWAEVIKRTALSAAVDDSLTEIVSKLMTRFSSKEGYRTYDDVPAALDRLSAMSIPLAITSNADGRMMDVLKDLELTPFFDPIVLSEDVGVEKPSAAIFLRTLQEWNSRHKRSPIQPHECLYVGDDLLCDYWGPSGAGMHALLMCRPGTNANTIMEKDLPTNRVVRSLWEVVEKVQQ